MVGKIAIFIGLILTATVGYSANLPWYETYFFPIGTWNTPRTEPVPIDYYYNDPPGAIDLWTAPSYQSLLDFGLDAVHFGSYKV